jgi:nucleotide-binding universal stress UspA family protein
MTTTKPLSRLLLPVGTLDTFERSAPLAGLLIRTMEIPADQVDLVHVVAGSFLEQRFKTVDLTAGETLSAEELQHLRADYLAGTAEPLLATCTHMIQRESAGRLPARLLRDGDPAKVIGSLCAEHGYSTLIMSRRPLPVGAGWVTGSVTASLLHRHAGATMYLVDGTVRSPEESPFARTLIGVDDAPASAKAVAEAALLLSRVNEKIERVTLVHVLDQSCYYNEDGAPCSQTSLSGQRALEQASTTLVEAGVDPAKITMVIHFGQPGTVLVEEVLDGDATMIFIGKRDRSRMAQLYLGSVCNDIVQNCRQRVLALVG